MDLSYILRMREFVANAAPRALRWHSESHFLWDQDFVSCMSLSASLESTETAKETFQKTFKVKHRWGNTAGIVYMHRSVLSISLWRWTITAGWNLNCLVSIQSGGPSARKLCLQSECCAVRIHTKHFLWCLVFKGKLAGSSLENK